MTTNAETDAGGILDQFSDQLTTEAAQRLVRFRVDSQTLVEIEELREKCDAGTLTEPERRKYEAFVESLDTIGIMQAMARRYLQKATA